MFATVDNVAFALAILAFLCFYWSIYISLNKIKKLITGLHEKFDDLKRELEEVKRKQENEHKSEPQS